MIDPEFYIDHEVRIRVQEKLAKDIHNLLRWIIGIGITSVIIPIIMKHYGF
jgi:phosphate starvation-inducible membrane PsiE